VPRMLHERSEVIREVLAPGGEPSFVRITASEVAERAGQGAVNYGVRRRAA